MNSVLAEAKPTEVGWERAARHRQRPLVADEMERRPTGP